MTKVKRKHHELLSEKRTQLAEKRTQLAHERTLMAYLRTATTLILFGIAFFGFSKVKFDFFYYAGLMAISSGIVFICIAIWRSVKHSREIRHIIEFFEKLIKYTYKKNHRK